MKTATLALLCLCLLTPVAAATQTVTLDGTGPWQGPLPCTTSNYELDAAPVLIVTLREACLP